MLISDIGIGTPVTERPSHITTSFADTEWLWRDKPDVRVTYPAVPASQ
jgi:hypothetical protein